MEGPKFEKPSEDSKERKETEKQTYQIANFEEQLIDLDAKRKEVMRPKEGRNVMDLDVGKLREVDSKIKTTKETLKAERDRISPEDRELIQNYEEEIRSFKFHYQSYKDLIVRYRKITDSRGELLPGADKEEYNKVKKELISLKSDLLGKRKDIGNLEEDLINRGLLRKSSLQETWRQMPI